MSAGRRRGSFSIYAEDVFGEVPPLPPVKIVRRFELQSDIEDLYTRRSRQPLLLSLDLRAQIAANNVSRMRILEAIEQYGAATVKAVMRRIMDRAERQLRDRLESVAGRHLAACRFPGSRHGKGSRRLCGAPGDDEARR